MNFTNVCLVATIVYLVALAVLKLENDANSRKTRKEHKRRWETLRKEQKAQRRPHAIKPRGASDEVKDANK